LQLGAGSPELQPAPKPPCGEPQPRQRLHRDRVCTPELTHIADHRGARAFVARQQRLKALAQGRNIGARDRAADGEDERAELRFRPCITDGHAKVSNRWAGADAHGCGPCCSPSQP